MAAISSEDQNLYVISDDDSDDLFMMTEFEAESKGKLESLLKKKKINKVSTVDNYDLNVVAEEETTDKGTHKKQKPSMKKLHWFKCSKCIYRTLDKLRFKQHTLDNHQKRVGRRKLYKCTKCDFKTDIPSILRFHQQKPCWKKTVKDITTKETLGFKVIDLDLSNDKIEEQLDQQSVTIKADELKCPYCPSQLGDEELKKHHMQNCHAEKRLSCASCSFETYEAVRLNIHVQIEHPARLLKCNKCDFTTQLQHLLNYHLFQQHSVAKLSCTHCEYKAAAKSELARHVQYKHGDWIQCKHCSLKVPTTESMAEHLLTHQVFTCKYCKFSTCDKQLIKDHEPAKQSPEAAKILYKCTMCLWTGKTKVCLVSHTSSMHCKSWLLCNKCDYKTKDLHSMDLHEVSVHKVERK